MRKNLLILASLAPFMAGCAIQAEAPDGNNIRPYEKNPFYWMYQGEPVLLLGASDQDNLFNHPDLPPDGLEAHLDLLVDSGGNYLRNTMSSRNPGNRFAFRQRDGGLFDLSEWDDEYWQRFEGYLEMTHKRGIVVQIEIWDPWDMYDSEGMGNTGWESHPYNPTNNVNYDHENSRLPAEVDYFPSPEPTNHSFFHTVPEMENNQIVLPYQQAFVDKILDHTFRYPHILYCMNNESGEDVRWGDYWLRYVRDRAADRGVEIYTTDMRRNEHINGSDHRYTHDQPELYTFVEISQNNGTLIAGQQHWDAITALREYIREHPRPLNNNKIYGGPGGWGGSEEGERKFWRNVFAGSASARFHRPPAGIGLSDTARAHIRSMRMVTEQIDIFRSEPRNDLLANRVANEAYLTASPGAHYAVYFPDRGSVTLDLSQESGSLSLKWLDVSSSEWTSEETVEAKGMVRLETPMDGQSVAVIIR